MEQRDFSFSIFFSLLGVGAGIALILTGLISSAPVLQQFYQPRGLGIVAGGLLAVGFLSFSAKEIRQSLGLLWNILSGQATPDREGLLKECVMLATRSRESEGQEQKLYREIKPYLSHQMLQAGVELLIAGYSPEMIKDTLQTRSQQTCLSYQSACRLLQTLSRAAWMLGLTAAAAGLLRSNLLSKPTLWHFYFGGIAFPLVVGLLLSILLFQPVLKQLQSHHEDWQNYLEMSVTGVLLLKSHHHAHYLETVLKAYLPIRATKSPAPTQPAAARPVAPSDFNQALQQQQPSTSGETSQESAEPTAESLLSVRQLGQFRPVKRDKDA